MKKYKVSLTVMLKGRRNSSKDVIMEIEAMNLDIARAKARKQVKRDFRTRLRAIIVNSVERVAS